MCLDEQKLKEHLIDKMTNQDIAKKYGLSFQKVIQIIKKYNLNPSTLRRTNRFIVYAHHYENKVIYIGSGLWYRCRRYSNRRNLEHQKLMKEEKIKYQIIDDFETREEAGREELHLIRQYKNIDQAYFNKQVK